MKSSEFIKGYTEMIVCALLAGGDDYIYSLVKRITESGGGEIQKVLFAHGLRQGVLS